MLFLPAMIGISWRSPLLSIFNFFKLHYKSLLFGFVLTLVSSFGQTFLLSLYVPHIRNDLSLSSTFFGSLYSLATLCSAFLLLIFGKRVDFRSLGPYTVKSLLLLLASCVLLAFTINPAMLFIALVGLRFSGQGLMGNISQTTISRHFEKSRGKALSVTSLGFSMGEMILPVFCTFLFSVFSWRQSIVISASLFILFVLILLKLLPIASFEKVLPEDAFFSEKGNANQTKDLKEKQGNKKNKNAVLLYLLKNRCFWAIAPVIGSLSMIVTGFFFYQMFLVEHRNWDPAWYTMVFTLYAVSRFIMCILSGFLVDKLGSRLLFPFHIIPFVIGSLLFGVFGHQFLVPFLLICIGVSMGSSSILKSAVYAELFGTNNIGEVRSVFTAIIVFGTALGPVGFGFLLDNGFSMEKILVICGILLSVFTLNSMRIWKRF